MCNIVIISDTFKTFYQYCSPQSGIYRFANCTIQTRYNLIIFYRAHTVGGVYFKDAVFNDSGVHSFERDSTNIIYYVGLYLLRGFKRFDSYGDKRSRTKLNSPFMRVNAPAYNLKLRTATCKSGHLIIITVNAWPG